MKRCLLLAGLLLSGCERDPWYLPASSARLANDGGSAVAMANPYTRDAQAIAEGKRLFRWYNCAGCHAAGGGGMGVALMDERWRYGADDRAIYASIVDGRPNGMPAFGARLSEDQAWRLAAYVRTMNGGPNLAVAPSRADDLRASEPEARREPRAASDD